MPVLSFCIPTFNRSEKVFSLVVDILKNTTNIDFNIIVLDNCSTDNTFNLLNSISDKRLLYIKNDFPIIGPLNIIKSLSYSNGEFAFLCLDKDTINVSFLENLISKLKSDKDLSFGYCKLNIDKIENDSSFKKGVDSLINMSYLSTHPTGMFFKTEYFKLINFDNLIIKGNKIFGFYPDLINAEMSMFGSSKIFGIPLFFTESRDDCETTLSFTFKKESDLFFTPINRLNTFLIYSIHLFGLNISKNNKLIILSRLFKDELISSTIVYKGILKNPSICKHYYIKPRSVSFFELLKIDITFTFNFLVNKLPISPINKIKIIAKQHIAILASVAINRIKK
jgi:glycosyltransferase involved in cell wall biosynthesis